MYVCNLFQYWSVLLIGRYALSFASEYLKMIYVNRTPESIKTVHVVSSALKATLTWHSMRTLQVVRFKKINTEYYLPLI